MKTLILLLFASISFAQNLSQQVFVGKINDKFAITHTLTTNGNLIYGQVVYKKEPIKIVGTIEQNQITLHELDAKGYVLGTYSGEKKGDKIEGIWYAPKHDAPEWKFTLTKSSETQVPKPAIKNVTGTYRFSFGKEDGAVGQVDIHQTTKDKISIAIDANRGGPNYNMAIIDKTTLKLTGNQAVYSNTEFGKCKLKITFFEGGLNIIYLDEAYDCGFGNGASVVGDYLKIDSKIPKFQSN
jgi:hypothetical protein